MRKSSSIQGMHSFNMKQDVMDMSVESDKSRNIVNRDRSNSRNYYVEENIKVNDSSLRKSYGRSFL